MRLRTKTKSPKSRTSDETPKISEFSLENNFETAKKQSITRYWNWKALLERRHENLRRQKTIGTILKSEACPFFPTD